jgi:hypothetical protein
MRIATALALLPLLSLVAACGHEAAPPGDLAMPDLATTLPNDMAVGPTLPLTISIHPGETSSTADGLVLVHGGDTDTEIVSVGSPAVSAARTGNGVALASADGNVVKDSFVQLQFPDALLLAASPTTSVIVTVEYWDTGLDSFVIEYDAADGAFTQTRTVIKTNTQRLKSVRFVLSNVYFGNRVNGADLRIDDRGDGSETIRTVTFTELPPPHRINVDSCGANPFDDLPDSDAIQTCVDKAVSGDVVTFTSAGGKSGYRGYLIDKTLYLVSGPAARAQLTFTATDPTDRPLLQATGTLKGPVMRLFSRAGLPPAMQGLVDDVTVAHLHLDGDRADRFCFGPNGTFDGTDDNWGSVTTNECPVTGDSWCLPGTLVLGGAFDFGDAAQDFRGNPDRWSTGLLADDLVITNTTCGTALGLNGADSAIARTTVDTAGDHVHATGCTKVKTGEPSGDWSDGFTINGPAHQIVGNSVSDPSDVGIVLFGGRETVVSGNSIHASAGNHGMFSAIAVHAWSYGDVGFDVIADNTVVNDGDGSCGGIHAGINLGPHMWAGACATASAAAVGTGGVTAGSCPTEPASPNGAACPATGLCQEWAWAAGAMPLTLARNQVTGAHINYLVEGFDHGTGGFVDDSNVSTTPRTTDWEAAVAGCATITWTPTDRIAHHPTLTGWTDVRVHCER